MLGMIGGAVATTDADRGILAVVSIKSRIKRVRVDRSKRASAFISRDARTSLVQVIHGDSKCAY